MIFQNFRNMQSHKQPTATALLQPIVYDNSANQITAFALVYKDCSTNFSNSSMIH